MTLKNILCLLFLILIVASCGPAKKIPEFKSATVEKLDGSDNVKYIDLPLEGKVADEDKLWSGDFWPLNKGSINLRWNALIQDGFSYVSPTREEIFVMTVDVMNTLSPAEKFDILMGRYDFPLKTEVAASARMDAEEWEGLENGWAAASMNHVEPKGKTLRNPDGLPVPFGSSDIKAILSYYYANVHKEKIDRTMGMKCELKNGWLNTNAKCKNRLDAGSFHVMLTNKVGLQKRPFFVDVERYQEIWNHPVVAYTAKIENTDPPGADATHGAASSVLFKTTITYIDRARINSMNPVLGTEDQVAKQLTYTYKVYTNYQGDVIGGKWMSSERPDFVWMMKGTQDFTGPFAGLNELLDNY